MSPCLVSVQAVCAWWAAMQKSGGGDNARVWACPEATMLPGAVAAQGPGAPASFCCVLIHDCLANQMAGDMHQGKICKWGLLAS